MAALDSIPHSAREQLSQIEIADLVVALPSCSHADTLATAIATLRPALGELLSGGRVVVLYPDRAIASPPADPPLEDPSFQLVPYPLLPIEPYDDKSLDQGLRSLLRVGQVLSARAFVLIGSELGPTTLSEVPALAEPIVNNAYDLVLPYYARRQFAGLMNSGIIYPLSRALYGARVRNPMAINMAISPRLADLYLQSAVGSPTVTGWMTTRAVNAGLQMCQVYRPEAIAPGTGESTDLSATLAHVLGAYFLEIERNANYWQKVRGSQPVRTFGHPVALPSENASVDLHTLVGNYQRGCKDLSDIWAVVLSPAPMVELRKIARLPFESFRISDELWAHILYDFILGHRQRLISRDHLLRALTPIYLGWVASYALQSQNLSLDAIESRLEQTCLALESLKPYLVSRWRWPDRFNP